jgi:hypothetical protein
MQFTIKIARFKSVILQHKNANLRSLGWLTVKLVPTFNEKGGKSGRHQKRFPLFTIAKQWNQQRCTSTDEWIKTTGCIYTMELYSAIKIMKLHCLPENGWNWRLCYVK